MKTRAIVLLAAVLLLPLDGHSAAARRIDEEVDRAHQLVDSSVDNTEAQKQIAALVLAIKRGEAASSGLKAEIQRLEKAQLDLKAENQRLEKVQTVLTSGLLGALATTVVALLGIFANLKRSRVDRDFRRLEVIEKARKLETDGVEVPKDIKGYYANLSSQRGRDQGT